MKDLENIKELISSKPDDAINQLLIHSAGNTELNNLVYCIKEKYNHYKKSEIKGIYSFEQLNQARSVIVSSLLNVADIVENGSGFEKINEITESLNSEYNLQSKSKDKLNFQTTIKITVTIGFTGAAIWLLKDVLISILIILISIYLIFDILFSDEE